MNTTIRKKIFLNISEIASFIGKNPYDSVTPFQRLWKRYDPEGYNTALNHLNTQILDSEVKMGIFEQQRADLEKDLETKRITKRQFTARLNKIEKESCQVKDQIADLTERIDNIQLTKEQQVEKALGKEVTSQIRDAAIETDTKRETTNKIINALDVSDTQKSKLKHKAENIINTSHGTIKEDSAIAQFEKKYKVKLDTSQVYHTRSFYATPQIDWIIGGKVDGLFLGNNRSESFVVEVKNRTKAFFNTLRDYEKCQIQLYIWMLDLEQAKLVEKCGERIRVTVIYRDQDFLEEIFECLRMFTFSYTSKFLSDAELKIKFLNGSDEEKKIILNKLYLSDITRFVNELFEERTKRSEEECLVDDLD